MYSLRGVSQRLLGYSAGAFLLATGLLAFWSLPKDLQNDSWGPAFGEAFARNLRSAYEASAVALPWLAPTVLTVLVAILVWLAIPTETADVVGWDRGTDRPKVSGRGETVELGHTRATISRSAMLLTSVYCAWTAMTGLGLFLPQIRTPLAMGVQVILLPFVISIGAAASRWGRGTLVNRYLQAADELRQAQGVVERLDAAKMESRHAVWLGWVLSLLSAIVPTVILAGAPPAGPENLVRWLVVVLAGAGIFAAFGVVAFFGAKEAWQGGLNWLVAVYWFSLWALGVSAGIVTWAATGAEQPAVGPVTLLAIILPGLVFIVPVPGKGWFVARAALRAADKEVERTCMAEEKLRVELRAAYEATPAFARLVAEVARVMKGSA